MLEHWHEFYGLVGTAAAALLALLFVAASIGAVIMSRETSGPTRTYMSPVAFHFTAVLSVSAIALVPSLTAASLAAAFACTAAAGLIYSAFVMVRLLRDGIADFPDRLAYGATPLLSYAAFLGGANLFFIGSPEAAYVLASGVMLLLIINVRNAWDLLLAMARAGGASLDSGFCRRRSAHGLA
jgi:hypothetical protein